MPAVLGGAAIPLVAGSVAAARGASNTSAAAGARGHHGAVAALSGSRGGYLRGARLQARAAPSRMRGGRGQYPDIQAVIPQLQGDANQQAPPDLPSYLFKNRIVYLGMSLVPAVTELIMAELMYLQYDDANKPIYFYINSTGTTKNGQKLGYDTEAFAIYDAMMFVKPPIYTLCVGNAFGEAAMLLSAGAYGHRASLPSSTIMLKQPISQFRGQATDLDIQRKEGPLVGMIQWRRRAPNVSIPLGRLLDVTVRNTKNELFDILGVHLSKSHEELEKDISRPLYLSPYDAVEYGVIDKVLEADGQQSTFRQ